jgi:HK97 family phage major capsid protein
LIDYDRFKAGELVDVQDDEAEGLVADGTARYARQADFDNDDGKYVFADKIAAQVKAELQGQTQSRMPFPGATYAADGWGPMNPKKFWSSEGTTGSNFDDCASFLKAVAGASKGHWDSRLAQKDIAHDPNASGGFLVPTEMANYVLSELLEDSPFFSQATLLPMTSNNLSVPFVADTDRSSTGMHGVTVPHVAEAAALADLSLEFAKCELKLHKIGGRCRVSNEMMEDSRQAMSILLPQLFADALSWRLQHEFISGTGAGECLGIMNSPALVSVAKETNQVAKTITYTNICKMWSRLLPRARKNAVWLINSDCEVQIRTMSLSVGTGGSSAFVLNAANQLPETIFGAKVYFTEHCQTLGTTGDIILCNPRAYAIGRKVGDSIRIEVSEHARFENDQTVFRATCRCDSQPLQSQPITPVNSTSTMSHFVALATRS